ncbi:major facilitator superfamily domain-containing protein [Parachaetomium inaequale]|uniref:Major facilitator superfamily domain-containing protein n=1 Tax=Parachaetomium inaequale TaxID=2588326 RepID=A0AAN6SPM6_9PEZI|nr:major facilitator superfamily domain-containing protein [Parachaetomium inaequale]
MANDATPGPATLPTEITERYSSFSRRQQNTIIGLAALGGWFSSISSFIYFPAIPFLTSYLIMSGIFPSIMGDAADRFGRRPVFLVALVVDFGANIGLALQSHFVLLFVFRMLQSAGISGTFSTAYGILGDLFTPAERGGYSGIIAFFLNTPPSLGPVLSGLLLLRWTWRSIFWLLAVSSALCLAVMAPFLPEMARSIVGNGSSPAKSINKALVPLMSPKKTQAAESSPAAPPREESRKFPNPLAALKLLRIPGTAIILLTYGINYTVYCCLQASLSTLFVNIYHVSGLVAGLVYLPFGVAVALSDLATGRLLDFNYKRTAAESGINVKEREATDLNNFPIECARLRTVNLRVALSAVLVVGYGWALQARVSMAAPLVLQFLIGLTIQVVFTALNTLLVDLHPECRSTAQAACNFVRCEMAATCLAGLDAMIQRLGPGWSFLLFGATLGLEFLMLLLVQLRGMKWRCSGPQGS